MFLIQLTQRTKTRQWNAVSGVHDETLEDKAVFVNVDAIDFFEEATDGGDRYKTHVRTRTSWDLFVLDDAQKLAETISEFRRQVHLI